MREILFRGKAVDSGKWVEGDLHHNGDTARPMTLIGQVVMSRDKHTTELSLDGFWLSEVDPATVGQYTGSNDKNGKKIFEGDIVAQPVCKYTVEFDEGAFFLVPISAHNPYGCPLQLIGFGMMFEVIGNIHDNPEPSEV